MKKAWTIGDTKIFVHPIGIIALLFFAITSLYLFTSPESVVIDKKGHISGFNNRIRAFLQGQRFWTNQLSTLDLEIKFLKAEPGRRAEAERDYKELLRVVRDKELESIFNSDPDWREARRKAQALRDQADAIEWEAAEQKRIKEWGDRIEELTAIRIILNEKKGSALENGN